MNLLSFLLQPPCPLPIQETMFTDAERDTDTFQLSLNGVTLILSSLGAKISKLYVPGKYGVDNIVLELPENSTENAAYFGVIVGRVANRIANGRLQVSQESPMVQLERNNWPNHLHGGSGGFSSRIWEAKRIDKTTVEFQLRSEDGDQSYPGTLMVKARYHLQEAPQGVRIKISLSGQLLDEIPTPVNLANHSYFNLDGHDSPNGVLDHTLQLEAQAYTPVNSVSIPTRQVLSLNSDTSMDWRQPRLIRDGLIAFAVHHAGKTESEAIQDVQRTRIAPDVATSGPQADPPNAPYGFDHNYVVRQGDTSLRLHKVGTLRHHGSRRLLTVKSTAPGVQLYTANYLDGSINGYGQWQALCLETQHFPDSVLVDKEDEFAKGKCPVLTKDNPHYVQDIEYDLEYPYGFENANPVDFRGSDTEGNQYDSLANMWMSQGVYSASTAEDSWYSRAFEYYETNCTPTLDGMLGGFASITEVDLKGSRKFVNEISRMTAGFDWKSGRACECGAGIGRVAKGLLLELTDECDLIESSPDFIGFSPEYLGDHMAAKCRFYCEGLQTWTPTSQPIYSIIWIQWVFCYLTDDDAVSFLKRCGKSLVPGGVIVLKENTSDETDFVVDTADASLSRSIRYIHWLAKEAELEFVHASLQKDFPDQIFPVYQLAIRPKQDY